MSSYRNRSGSLVTQTNELAGLRVHACDVGAFVAITVRTRECEIAQKGFASMLLCDDVVDLKRQRKRKLRNAAIFAAISGSLANRAGQLPIHCRAEDSV